MQKDAPVADCLTTNCLIVEATAGENLIREIFEKSPVQFLPVVEGLRFAGIIFRREFLKSSPESKEPSRTAANLVSSNVIPLSPETSLNAAADIFENSSHDVIPVVDEDGDLAGLLLRHEVEKFFPQQSKPSGNVTAK